MKARFCALFAVLAFSCIARGVQAEPIVGGTTTLRGRAIQDFFIPKESPINLIGEDWFLDDVAADGYFRFEREAQSGTTINFIGTDSLFQGTIQDDRLPAGVPFDLGTGAPLAGLGGFDGSITNVEQDETDPGYSEGAPSSFQSGNYVANVDSFALRLHGTDQQILVATKAPFTFEAEWDGLPPSVGTNLEGGQDWLEVFLVDENGITDLLVAQSRDRRIVSVPEPGSLITCLCGMGVLVGLGLIRRRRAN